MRLIGYLRVRTVGGVVEGVGFAEQDRQIRSWADRHGHVVVRTVVDRSSTDTPAAGLAGAVRAVWANEADAVIVTSRRRLGIHESLGATVLAVDDPEPVPPPPPPIPDGTQSRTSFGWMVAQWVAIAVAAFVAHGVASAASPDDPSRMKGRCVSAHLDVVPCDGTELGTVLSLDPTDGCDFFNTAPFRRADGTWLCVGYR